MHGFKRIAGTQVVVNVRIRKPTRLGYYIHIYLQDFSTPFVVHVSESGDVDTDYVSNGSYHRPIPSNGKGVYISSWDLIQQVMNRYNCHLLRICAMVGNGHSPMSRFFRHPLCDFRGLWELIQAYMGYTP